MSEIMDNYISKVHENEKDLTNQSISIGGGVGNEFKAIEKVENRSTDIDRSVDD